MALRLMIYDRTCRGRRGLPGLSHAWAAGGRLYHAMGRLDAWCGAASWAEALDWLATVRAGEPVAEVQLWMHGRWGQARIAGEALDAAALEPGHPHHARLVALRERLVPGGSALFWFRTCETFGRAEGHAFARAWTGFFGCRAAGHTHVIGIFQSGLHLLEPGGTPDWPVDEGMAPGAPRDEAVRTIGAPSRPWSPRTVTFLAGQVPRGY